eukprot:10978144-Alexandrium_andersonii.AAC.1
MAGNGKAKAKSHGGQWRSHGQSKQSEAKTAHAEKRGHCRRCELRTAHAAAQTRNVRPRRERIADVSCRASSWAGQPPAGSREPAFRAKPEEARFDSQ